MKKSVLTLSVAAILNIPFAARADVITGVLNFTGEANISSSVGTPGSIVFTGNTFTVQPSTDGFAPLAGDTGIILPITNPPDAVDIPLTDTFMTLPAAGADGITFTITDLFAGIDGETECADPVATAGQVCTPAPPISADVSPFNLQNTSATSSSASFNLIGYETDIATGDTEAFSGSFSDPAVDMSYQAILGEIEGGGTFTTPFSAQIVVDSTPEPNSLVELMMGIGLVGIGLVYRKKLKKA
jgi:hypothetical protein